MRRWNVRLGRLAAWVVLLLPLVVLARGGGGQNFRGFSLPHSGGGDGRGIPLRLVWDLVGLAVDYPGVFLSLMTLYVGYVVYSKRNDRRTRAAIEAEERRQRDAIKRLQIEVGLRQLKSRDPAFEFPSFEERIRNLFLQVQQAWFVRDLEPVRPFLSDATFQRLRGQLDLLNHQGVRNAIADVRVLGVSLVGLEQSNWFDTVHVLIRAQMRDTDVPSSKSDAEAEVAARRASRTQFKEVWSFVRKQGVRTKAGEGLPQGKCPNCGAPFSGGATNVCEYCGAVVNSGQYDWTLSEITQEAEYVRPRGAVHGLAEGRVSDPALNLEILEDRASLIFWKWIIAQSHAEPRELAKLATPEFVSLLGLLQPRRFLECAVGGVNVLALHPAQELDEAHVEIVWSARTGGDHSLPQRWVFILVRKSGATTRTDNGMATHRCPRCNAALSDSLTSVCDYCGEELSSGEADWVLREALAWDSWTPPWLPSRTQRLVRVFEVAERERLLHLMAALAVADGAVDAKERALLRICAKRWSVEWSKVESTLKMGAQSMDREMVLSVSRGTPGAENVMRSLVDMALVDGRVDRRERQMLEHVAGHLGLAHRLDSFLGS